MRLFSFGVKMIFGFIAAIALVVLLFSPVFGTVILSFLAMGMMIFFMLRKVWLFSAPERTQFTRAMVNSVDLGPLSGGLVPMLAWLMLMALIVVATFGVI